MKTIIYIGGFRLPDRNAGAVRAFQNALLLNSLGYRVILLGKFENDHGEIIHHESVQGLECMDIRKPFVEDSFPDYTRSSAAIEAVVEKEGAANVAAIIAYNYPLRGLRCLLNAFQRSPVKIIADCTEWYGWEGMGFARDLLRVLATEIRMRYFVPKTAGVICASRYLAKYYPNKSTFLWPFCVQDLSYFAPLVKASPDSKLPVFTYCGNPGAKIKKDRLDVLIKAFSALASEEKQFLFNVVGLSESQYLEIFPQQKQDINAMGDKIRFHGRKTRDESIKFVAASHYSVFVRPQNRVSHVGFATKIYEAFCCGVPTITNDTSDNSLYIKDGENGFIVDGEGVMSLKVKLDQVLDLDHEAYMAIRSSCREQNPFDGKLFAAGLKSFIETAS